MRLEEFLSKFVGKWQKVDICENIDESRTIIVGERFDVECSAKWGSVKERNVVNIMTVDYDEDYPYSDIERELNDSMSVLVIYVE